MQSPRALTSCSPIGHVRCKPNSKVRDDGKKLWDYLSVYRPINLNDAIDHLAGKVSIAGVPLIDSDVRHAAIDIDEYGTLDEAALQNRVIGLGLGELFTQVLHHLWRILKR
jgi:hypothetical protein